MGARADGAATRARTRDIARAAVRAELGPVALELFMDKGFDNVTVDELAAATGVSRSTFLRYFGTKEDAALSAFNSQGQQALDAVRERPASEDDWTALRHGLGVIVDECRLNSEQALALNRLLMCTPALRARRQEQKHELLPLLAQVLADRGGSGSALACEVKAAAALNCLSSALAHWTRSDGKLDLAGLVDEAFAVFEVRDGSGG